ncbi:hypothetical protein HDU79_008254 [Rhizoclosmatium sp. JEL0117]|nr:hypothetical protein HDU79_008254 [Rhizoclosmatium sp. JEL0117]
MLQCVWSLDEGMYNMISNSLDMKASYTCRVPMSKEASIYFPLTFSFWGQVEPTHIHLMTHWNFLFHAMDGFFLGGSVYPLRDHWVAAEKGSVLLIHGPVRWFAAHTFESTLQDAWLHNANAGTVPNSNAETAKQGPLPPRPIIAPPENANVKPVKEADLPTVSKLLSAIPRSSFIFYVFASIGASFGISTLVYYAYLKPKLLLEKKPPFTSSQFFFVIVGILAFVVCFRCCVRYICCRPRPKPNQYLNDTDIERAMVERERRERIEERRIRREARELLRQEEEAQAALDQLPTYEPPRSMSPRAPISHAAAMGDTSFIVSRGRGMSPIPSAIGMSTSVGVRATDAAGAVVRSRSPSVELLGIVAFLVIAKHIWIRFSRYRTPSSEAMDQLREQVERRRRRRTDLEAVAGGVVEEETLPKYNEDWLVSHDTRVCPYPYPDLEEGREGVAAPLLVETLSNVQPPQYQSLDRTRSELS